MAATHRLARVALWAHEPGSELSGFREGLTIARRMAAREPGNTNIEFNIWDGLHGLADAKRKDDDARGAIDALQESLPIVRKLAAEDPGNTQFQSYLSTTLHELANLKFKEGKLGDVKLKSGRPSIRCRHVAQP